MSDVKARIDAPAGLIELEGDREFVSAYLDKLLPLIEATGLGRGARTRPLDERQEHTLDDHLNGDTSDAPEQPKKKRRIGKPAPAGSTCRDRITVLREEKFFTEQKTPTEIVAGLAKKGWTHSRGQVSAALSTMFEKAEIQRTKNDSSAGFTYFWDRN
jgi:hypothetical protein